MKYSDNRKKIVGGCALVLLAIIIGIYYSQQNGANYTRMLSSYQLCDIKTYAKLAEELNLPYQFDYSRHHIGMKFQSGHVNSAKIRALFSNYNNAKPTISQQQYADAHYAETIEPAICHLNNVKNHVETINPNLLPHIPNDVDHVSYHPHQDKAVYCYYLQGKKGGSQCFYINLDRGVLTKDDISDMERVNLEMMVKRYPHVSIFRNKTPEEFDSVHSAVIEWTDTPPNLRYGITFATFAGIQDFPWAVQNY